MIFFRNVFATKGLEVSVVDFLNLDKVRQALKPSTRLIFFETPTNPCLRIVDIKSVAALVHSYNQEILLACDNTFLTPYFQRVLALGVDVCMYSFSKYVNGHTDVVMGALTMNNDTLFEDLDTLQTRTGCVPSPYDCHMVQRSLRTLAIRMMAHFKNGVIVAKFLESHPAVEKVHHPALWSHPDHKLATEQAAGHSGMICFWLKDATLRDNEEVLSKLKLIFLQGSLGGVETFISTP